MVDATEQFIERYRALGLLGAPCSATEVADVEHLLSVSLPAAYKAYLRIAGHHSPPAWVGSDCTIERLPQLQEWGNEFLRECGQPPLPAQAVVFVMHQGYQFYYFVADGSDDPPAFYFLEGEAKVAQRFEHISDLVAIVAADSK